jgi:RNA polymerase sigma-70 factor (ECF subfamily)
METATDGAAGTAEFEAWYRGEHPRMVAALTVACGNRDVAADASAEAFARAFAAWKRVSQMDAPGGWTYRVAVNVLRRRGRRAALEARLLRRLPPAPPPMPAERAVEVWDAVRALPARERLAIALRYAAGLSESDVGDAMGVAVGTASATLVSARRKLAIALADDREDQDG